MSGAKAMLAKVKDHGVREGVKTIIQRPTKVKINEQRLVINKTKGKQKMIYSKHTVYKRI